jgi:hypothetical protein
MKILFDQSTPVPLRGFMTGHTVSTAFEMNWTTLTNGMLLTRAETEFEVIVTTDQNLRYQQNLTGRRLAILVLTTTSWPIIRAHTERILEAINAMQAGEYVELKFE